VDPDAIDLVVGVGPGIGMLKFSGDRRRGKGSFGRGSLGLSNVTNGIICMRVDDVALLKLLWVFSCYIDKAHRAVIFAIAQLSCFGNNVLACFVLSCFNMNDTV